MVAEPRRPHFGLGRGGHFVSLLIMFSQLPHQHIHLLSQLSVFYLVNKNPKLSNNPGEKLTFLCLSNETTYKTLILWYEILDSLRMAHEK